MMSIKDTVTAQLNEAVAKRNALNYDDYEKAALESFAADRRAATDYINSTYDTASANTQAHYDKAVTDAKVSYDSDYQKNAVQKLINEKQVAEKMANLGLTDSGLNRTQQTAVQLSYANQRGKIDLARQSAIDDLTLNLTAAISDIEAGRSGDLLTANEKWDDKAYSFAQTNYNNDLTAYNDQISSYVEQLSNIEQNEIANSQWQQLFNEQQRQYNQSRDDNKKIAAYDAYVKSQKNIENAKKNILSASDFKSKAVMVTRGNRGNTGNGGYKYEGKTYNTYNDYVFATLDSMDLTEDEMKAVLEYLL